jgi:hypothetical protein
MWGKVSLVALFALGCSGASVDGLERVELQCAGTIPDTPVRYRYELHGGDAASILVGDGTREARAAEAGESVSVEFDFLGAPNGGAFTFHPLGEFLAVDYIDTDQNRFWSLFCFE